MKRAGRLFELVVERDNLRLAFVRAARGKRDRGEVRKFADRLEENLRQLQDGLWAGTVPLGRFRQFVIHDPKERIITAPCFEERVLHHALMNVCEPHFERGLIDDTFACRRGKGRDAAVLRAQAFSRRFPWFLKLDVRKYFDSVPHARLREGLERLFKDRRLLDLWWRIVGSFRGATGRGLPIGSLTSQHLANFYLGRCDRFVKERLRVRGYVRYMDDMVLWGEDSATLASWLDALRQFLVSEMELELRPAYVNRAVHGIDFLGCRVFRRHRTLNRRSRVRFRRKLAALERCYLAGRVDERHLQLRADALVAFTRAAGIDSWRFRQRVLERLRVSGQ